MLVVCRCGARNTQSGQCIVCGAELGSLPRAIVAAGVATALLVVVWVVLAWALGAQTLWFAMLFGGVVSGAVVQFSAGRGWSYQLVASLATIVGIGVADAVLLALIVGRTEALAGSGLLELTRWQLENDPITALFAGLGVFGGFFVWHQPGGGE